MTNVVNGEVLEKEFLYKVLTSHELCSGIKKAIGITEEKGREAYFGVYKPFGENTAILPTEINIGSENSAGFRAGREFCNKWLKGEFVKTYGREPILTELTQFLAVNKV
ncbi:MAG: hypothetical protein J4473_03455 [Candidatus Aenigmarchaeota archaeon]|nr:hypothetical protein [Candidatus Aenigmarchaeota archaeon]